MATVNLGRVGLVLKGEWDSTTAYTALDVVSHDGNAWAAKQNSTNVEPTTVNSDFWQLFSNNADLVATVQGYKEDAASSAAAAAASAQQAEEESELGANAMQGIAPVFAPTEAYSATDYVWYRGILYRFTENHSAGEWIGTDAEETKVGTEIADLKSAITQITGNEIIQDWASGYYETGSSKTSVDVNTIKANAGYVCTYHSCNPGDIYYYTGYGTTAARPWAFLQSDGTILPGRASAGSYTLRKIVAPENATTVIFNAEVAIKHEVIQGELLVNRVSALETDVQTNSNDITNLNNTVASLFESKTAKGTGEIIDVFQRITSVDAGNATSVTIATAQMFEALYPGTPSQSGVSVTKNDDGTYTINGQATAGVWFRLNQTERTGSSNRVSVNGLYSFGYDIVSGSYDKGTYQGGTPGIVALIDLDVSSTVLASLTLGGENEGTYEFSNKAVAMAFRLTTGVIYNNLRIAIRMNRGEKLFPYSTYVTPITLTDFEGIVNTAQAYTPYIWLTSTPITETLIVNGKVFATGGGGSLGIDLYGVLEKYNDRVDILAQMFANPLLLIYTDIHGNAENLARIDKWYSSNKPAYVSDVYCLGDMVRDQYADAATDLAKFDEIPIWGKTLKVIGNHDVSVSAGTGPAVSATTAYNTYIAPYVSNWSVVQPTDASAYGKSYYYKDYASAFRVIVLDTYFYTQEQHDWFVETLENARANNLAVIVAEHEDICTASEKQPFNADYPFAKKHNGYTNLQYRTYGDGGDYQTKRNAVNTFIGNGGEFICWLVGHQHADMCGTYDGGTNGKQASILLSNASNSMTSSMRFNNYSQDCFTYLGVDTTNKYLYLLRIGEAVDKWFHRNLFLVYDYVNHSVVEYH